MTDASTTASMSPERMKVADRAKRQPAAKFHSLAHLMVYEQDFLAQVLAVAPEWLAFGHECGGQRGSVAGRGERLHRAREAAGLTLEGLARKAGYARRGSIRRQEQEVYEMDLLLCEHLAKLLEVNPEWLAFGHECP